MDLENLTDEYQTITGTPDNLAKLAKQLKHAHQPFQWVQVIHTTPHQWNEHATALKISRDVVRALLGA